MCLYVYVPQTSDARLVSAMKLEMQSDAIDTQSIPLPVPPSFHLGDIAMCDNVKFFRLTIRRKLFFGLPMVAIPPIPRIGLREGRSYHDPLDSVNMTPMSEALLFLQFIHSFGKGGIFIGYDMPSSRFLHFVAHTWIRWLKPFVSKALVMCSEEVRWMLRYTMCCVQRESYAIQQTNK